MHLLPKTRLGKWAVRCGATFVILFGFSSIVSALNALQLNTGGTNDVMMNPVLRPLLIGIGLFALASGVASFFTGIVSITKHNERAILVYLFTVLGFLALLFILGELFLPH